METIIVKDDEIDARWMLAATLVLASLLLCLQVGLCIAGDIQTEYPLVYVVVMGTIIAANIAALFVIRHSLLVAAYGFCLFVMGAIVFMVLVGGDQQVPSILLVMLPVCAYSLAYFVTTRQMLPYLALVVLTMLAFGSKASQIDETIPSVAASVIGSFLVSRLRTHLYKLRVAIKILSNHGRENKELAEHLRRIAGHHTQ